MPKLPPLVDTLTKPNRSEPLIGVGVVTVSAPLRLALSTISEHAVETRWSDASVATAPWQKAQGDPDWAGEAILSDLREISTDAPLDEVWRRIESIGGTTGWYGVGILWWMRGAVDRAFGGVGLRRGRRDPHFLRVGESLDFWRVVALEPEKRLRLYAEMILPGKAWLEFRVEKQGETTHVVQEATFAPRGLGGQIYWHAVSPFHGLVFPVMLRNIVKSAERGSRSQD